MYTPPPYTTHQSNARARRGTASPPPAAPDISEDNYYQLLGVEYTATSDEITRAYRTSMKRAHPDRMPPERRAAAEDLSKALNHAYKTLTNPTSRARYDQTNRVRQQEIQDQVMKRYVGGFAGPGIGGRNDFGSQFKREMSQFERADRARSDRSAVMSLFAVFLVITLGAIGLLIMGSIVSYLIGLVF